MTGRISSYCTYGNCCAVAPAPGGIYMFRKVTGDAAPTSRLLLTTAEFRAFVLGVKAGEFDDFLGDEALRAPVSLPRVAGGEVTPDGPCTAVTSDLRAHAPHRGEHA